MASPANGNNFNAADFNTVFPEGTIMPYSGLSLPADFLQCDGTAVSRTTYSGLLTAIMNPRTVTVTIASPGVFSLTSHGFVLGDAVSFKTTGALPTGLSAGVVYYVISAGLTSNAFEVSLTRTGSAVNTSGSQNGTHTVYASNFGIGDGSTTFNLPYFPTFQNPSVPTLTKYLTYDATSTGSANSTTLTVSHTCDATARLLVVSVTATNTQPTITYAGVSMTFIASDTTAGGFNTFMFYLLNPTAGANNIVVTISPSGTMQMDAASFKGNMNGLTLDASGHANGSSTTVSASATATVAYDLIVVGAALQTSTTFTTPTGYAAIIASSAARILSYNNGVPGTGSQTFTSTIGASDQWSCVVCCFKAYVTTPLSYSIIRAKTYA